MVTVEDTAGVVIVPIAGELLRRSCCVGELVRAPSRLQNAYPYRADEATRQFV
jgi:hypothetical protein